MDSQYYSPFLKALASFAIGSLFRIYTDSDLTHIFLIACLPAFIWLTLQLLFAQKFITYNNRWTSGLSIWICFLCLGYLLTTTSNDLDKGEHFSYLPSADAYIAIINQEPIEKEKSYKTTVEITKVFTSGKSIGTTGSCLVYLSKDLTAQRLKYGDEIIFSKNPIPTQPPLNPEQFDYKRYLSYRNIYHQLHLKQDDWKLIGEHNGNPIIAAALDLRKQMTAVFKKNNISGQDHAVLSALMLGDVDEIHQSTIDAFAASGTLHILSVSGMHVGFIFLAINNLLFFMNRNRALKAGKNMLIFLSLACYAVLTGLSPPVVRASLMLILIQAGKAIMRQPISINIVAASALLLLCYNPFYIMDVGFQLSFMAIAGIVLLYKPIRNCFYSRFRLLNKGWGFISVSLAAQAATMPLCFFYFHQFPNYFLLSNLLIVPLSELIIYSGIVLLVLFKWTWGALLWGKAVAAFVHLLVASALWIEQLPYALITGISISIIEALLIYIVIFLITFFVYTKRTQYITSAVIACCILLCFQIKKSIEARTQRQMIVFNVPKNKAIGFIAGRDNYFLTDSTLADKSIAFNINPYLIKKGFTQKQMKLLNGTNTSAELYMKENFIRFYNKKVVVLNNTPDKGNKIKVNYVIITGNPKLNMNDVSNYFDADEIIFDSSNSYYHCNKWQLECHILGIRCHAVPLQGAFLADV